MYASAAMLSKASKGSHSPVLVAYLLFLACGTAVYQLVANGEFSAILTLAAMLQCLALVLLAIQTLSSHSAAGVSVKALALDAFALCCRLSSTLWLNGYLPVDASGDWVYQAVDICSLLVVLFLLWYALLEKRETYQAEADSFPVGAVALGAVVLAGLLHADMNQRPLFDALWLASLFLGVVAVLPQLWLIVRTGNNVEALTSHYIACMALGRALSGVFMWHARFDITCVPWVEGVNHAVWAILAAHFVHILLLVDFMYAYFKAVAAHGLQCRLNLEGIVDSV